MLGTLFILLTLGYPGDVVLHSPPAEESYITSVKLEAVVLEDNQTVEVTINYHVKKSPGTRTLSFEGLETFDAQFGNVDATIGGKLIPLEPRKESIKITGDIELPEESIPDSSITVVLTYSITNANLRDHRNFNINIPVLWIEQARSRSDQHLFKAHLSLPEQYYVNESFPTITAGCTTIEETNYACISLQVIPTFLRFRGVIGYNPLLTPLQALDLSIVSLLVGTCAALLLLLVRRQQLHKQPV